MTNEQIEKDREFVKSLLTDLSSKAKNMWLVCVVWESPITHVLEHREGYFTDHTEAQWFADMLEDTYGPKKFNFTHELYFFRTDS